MERVRGAVAAALFMALLATTGTLVAAVPLFQAAAGIAASVSWPPSTLVVSEVQAGGASASDEFAEIANVGSAGVDLNGTELVYVTSTGGTVTRKASWSSPLVLGPGRHLIVANTSGVFASIADATYSGGFAATGGAVVLRVIGGAPIDAIGWGDATNSFVEGSPVAAPAAGQSVERRPGGIEGNTIDTNDNAADLFVQPIPNPQNLAAPPVPAPSPSPSVTPAPTPAGTPPGSPDPTPDATPDATAQPTPGSTPAASPTGTPDMSPGPTSTPTATPPPTPTPGPTPTSAATPAPTTPPTPAPTTPPTPAPTAPPTPAPTPTAPPTPAPTPAPTAPPTPTPTAPTAPPVPIRDARALAIGSATLIEGVLTTDLGALEAGRAGFVQDETAGIAVYLDIAPASPIPAGTVVRLSGTIDERYAARTLRATLATIGYVGIQDLPAPALRSSGAVGEGSEGLRVLVAGTTVGSATTYADGLGYLVDDGTGQVRVIVSPVALGGASVPSGTSVSAVGPVGQRDSTGTGSSGYRIHATLAGEFAIVPPQPTPAPTVGPSPAPTQPSTPAPTATSSPRPTSSVPPTPGSTPGSTPSPTTGGSPAASPTPGTTAGAVPIADARSRPTGSAVTVSGVVTAEAGRLGIPSVIVIADDTGGIAVRLPSGTATPPRGRQLLVSGVTAAPYGQLEIRPTSGHVTDIGIGSLPTPIVVTSTGLGEATEERLVVIVATQKGVARKSATGDLTIDLIDSAGAKVRVMADASSGITQADLRAAVRYRLTGIVGQRATRTGALDGYRIWLRDRADIVTELGPPTHGSGSDDPGKGPAGDSSTPNPVVTIAAARHLTDVRAAVVGTVIAGSGLLDADGRRIVIQDATGGIELLLPVGSASLAIGTTVRVEGTVYRAWGAPRIKVATFAIVDPHASIAPRHLSRPPAESDEWQLVRVAGTIARVTRLGDRWKAELRVGGTNVLIDGLATSGIPSTLLSDGRAATIVGFVHRPYPTATDRRWAVTPRGHFDVAIGPRPAGAPDTKPTSGTSEPTAYEAATSEAGTSLDVDLATLSEHVGAIVRVGGILDEVTADGCSLDDGTARVWVTLEGEAAAFLPLLHRGDAIGLVGRVAADPATGSRIIVSDPSGVVRLGELGEVVPIAAIARDPGTGSGDTTGAGDRAVDETWNGAGLGADLGRPVLVLGLVLLAAVLAITGGLAYRRRRDRITLARRLNGRLATLRREGRAPEPAP